MSSEQDSRKKGTASSADGTTSIRNQDFAALAVLLCGGGDGQAHIEDIALKAYQLAPTRFKWERYDYPSLDTVRVALRADRGPEDLVLRSGGKFYSLTSDGIGRALELGRRILGSKINDAYNLIKAFEQKVPTISEPAADTGVARHRPAQKYLRHIKSHETFRAWKTDRGIQYELWQLAELLECMPDASLSTWNSRLENLKRQATFWRDDEVSRFADEVSKSVHRLLAAETK